MLYLDKIGVIQDGFRLSSEELHKMILFVKDGGRFNEQTLEENDCPRKTLIAITEFEDGERYLRDGFHRAIVIALARDVPALFDDEYVIEHMTYSMFRNPEPANEWVTPFDPKTEVRKADFFEFKREALESENPVEFIERNRDRYCVKRNNTHTMQQSREKLWRLVRCLL